VLGGARDFVMQPIEGGRRDGVRGVAKGLATGAVSLVITARLLYRVLMASVSEGWPVAWAGAPAHPRRLHACRQGDGGRGQRSEAQRGQGGAQGEPS
jgi:hypothetical protein